LPLRVCHQTLGQLIRFARYGPEIPTHEICGLGVASICVGAAMGETGTGVIIMGVVLIVVMSFAGMLTASRIRKRANAYDDAFSRFQQTRDELMARMKELGE